MFRMMKTAIAAAALLGFSSLASAAAPTKINLQGVLRANLGGLEDGAFTFRVQIFPDATSTTALLDEMYPGTPVSSGVFSIDVGGMTANLATQLAASTAPQVQISVNGNAMPKQPLGSVAFALHSETAVSATAVPFTGVSGFPAACASNQKLLGYSAGTANCATDIDTDTGLTSVTVTAGSGITAAISGATNNVLTITVDGNFQRRTAANALTCAAGNFLRAVAQDGAPTCAADADTGVNAITNGGGITGTIAGRTLTLGSDATVQRRSVAPTCTAPNFIRSIAADGTPTCVADANSGGTVTSITAGTGLSGGTITTTGTIAVNFDADGVGVTASRDDHRHPLGCHTVAGGPGAGRQTAACASNEQIVGGGCSTNTTTLGFREAITQEAAPGFFGGAGTNDLFACTHNDAAASVTVRAICCPDTIAP